MPHRPTVAIIGGGFSGLLTAIHLAIRPDGPRVRLIDRSGAFARGAAYSTANPHHLLNVRLANMSAFPDRPDHFTEWLAHRDGWSAHGGFVTRGIYGDYLQDILRQALDAAGADRLLLELDEAVDLEPAVHGWRVRMGLGQQFDAQAVVLAPGVLRPSDPPGAEEDLIGSARYLGDPWDPRASVPDTVDEVLMIGSGMTMVDTAISLARPGRVLWSISRRGLTPRAHGAVAPRPSPDTSHPGGSPLALLRALRAAANAEGWREAVDDLRPHLRGIWTGWNPAERRAFLRHLRPWWDVYRHRLAPSVARQIANMVRAHELVVRAGQILRFTPQESHIEVLWRPRGATLKRRLVVGAVVNCTGQAGDIAGSRDPLLRSLIARGLIGSDPNGLGVDVDARSRLIAAAGVAHDDLYAVGPLTRGRFWETTAVPDIRVQAAEVAAAIVRGLARGASAA